ncbi:MAG: DUF4190 domain-containing protein [Planctomycetota bacterium]|jgi:hypothetical protein
MSESRQPKLPTEEVGDTTDQKSGSKAGDKVSITTPAAQTAKTPFARQAAKASWVAPLLCLSLSYLTKPASRVGNMAMVIFMLSFIVAGLVFGIIALFGIRKYGRKGILKPAIAGIIVNVLFISLIISLWVFLDVTNNRRLRQEGEQMGMDLLLNYPGWMGATFMEGAVLTVTSVDDSSEAARDLNKIFWANISHLIISLDNSAGKEDFEVNPSLVSLVLADGTIEPVLPTRQILQTAREQKQKWIDTYTGPFIVAPGEQLTACFAFIPHGFDMSKVVKAVVNINGQDMPVVGSYMAAEQKAKLIKSGIEHLEQIRSFNQFHSNQSESGDRNIFLPVADNILLVNVGVETNSAFVEPIFTAGSKLPLLQREIFSTAVDDQQTVDIHVLQGFRPLSKYNRTLSRFQITQLPRAPRGVLEIELTFDIDAEAERMRQEANRFSQQDSVEVKLIQSRNQAELMLYVAEYDLSPSETQRSILEGLMANVKSHLADQSPEQLIAQMYALQVHMEKITGKKYILERGIFLDDL